MSSISGDVFGGVRDMGTNLRGTRLRGNGKYTFPWSRGRDICAVLVCAGAGFHIYHGTTG